LFHWANLKDAQNGLHAEAGEVAVHLRNSGQRGLELMQKHSAVQGAMSILNSNQGFAMINNGFKAKLTEPVS